MKISKIFKNLFHPQRSNNHRPKLLHPKPLVFLTIIALGFYQVVGFAASLQLPRGSILGYASSISIDQVIEGTNQERSNRGLVALTLNQALSEAALAKAQDMFNEQYWAHTSPSGKEPWDFIKGAGYIYKVAGENLARDFDTTAPMIQAWMNSPTHRANIMNPRYKEIGLAVVDGRLNGTETTLVVQMFGTLATESQAGSVPEVEVPTVASVTDSTNLEFRESERVVGLDDQATLSKSVVPQGSLSQGILMSPLHLMKAFFLSMILLIAGVLIYDGFVAGHRNSVRLVGKNLAHIMFFSAVAYLIIYFKGGAI